MNVKWIQSRLTAHGFSPGPIDGTMGPTTRAAIKAFQKSKGLNVDGLVGLYTDKALASSSAASPGSAPYRPVTTPQWPTQAQILAGKFGLPGENLVTVEVPYRLRIAWDVSLTTKKMTLNKHIADSAIQCLEQVMAFYDEEDRHILGLDLFGGAFNKRRMRGGSQWSMHAFGCAIDFDPERNQLKWGRDRARLAQPDCEQFWKIWEANGWTSLGRSRNYDWMHVQVGRLA